MAKTGKFPQSPKDPQTFREQQMEGMKTFKGGTSPSNPFGGYSANTVAEGDKGPYGRQRLAAAGEGREGNQVKKIKDTLKVPAKEREIIFEKLPTTKTPKGRYHPVRGEHPNL